jgi:hypothetical protein
MKLKELYAIYDNVRDDIVSVHTSNLIALQAKSNIMDETAYVSKDLEVMPLDDAIIKYADDNSGLFYGQNSVY